MKIDRRSLLTTLLLAPVLTPSLGQAQASPAAVVERLHASLLAVMQTAQRLGARGREQQLRPVMEAAFNLPAMARIAVGPSWTQLPAEDQQAITSAFTDWTIATYAQRFDGFGGERFETEGETTLQNADQLVRTRLVRPNDAPVQLNYLVRQFGGAWRIVDVYLTGTISELASRRAEFTALLRDGGAPRLVTELRQRAATALKG